MTDTTLKDKLLVPASRVAKILVTAALTFAATKWGIHVPPEYEWVRDTIEQLIAFATASSLAGLAVHYGVGIKANPRDTVSPTEAKVGRAAKKARKTTRAVEERIEKAGADGEGEDPESPEWLRPPGE